MSNNFHLLIKSEPESYYSDEQVKQRIEKYMDKDKDEKKKKMENQWCQVNYFAWQDSQEGDP